MTVSTFLGIGGIFTGIGAMVVSLTVAILLYYLCVPVISYVRALYGKETKWIVLEETQLDKYAQSKGIDLKKEMIKRDIVSKKDKNFRKKVENQIYKEFFEDKKIV